MESKTESLRKWRRKVEVKNLSECLLEAPHLDYILNWRTPHCCNFGTCLGGIQTKEKFPHHICHRVYIRKKYLIIVGLCISLDPFKTLFLDCYFHLSLLAVLVIGWLQFRMWRKKTESGKWIQLSINIGNCFSGSRKISSLSFRAGQIFWARTKEEN